MHNTVCKADVVMALLIPRSSKNRSAFHPQHAGDEFGQWCGNRRPAGDGEFITNCTWYLCLVVFSLSFLIIWDNAEAAQYDHLLLWSFLPAVRMPMSIPVSQRCLQGFGQLIQRFETPALKRQGA